MIRRDHYTDTRLQATTKTAENGAVTETWLCCLAVPVLQLLCYCQVDTMHTTRKTCQSCRNMLTF